MTDTVVAVEEAAPSAVLKEVEDVPLPVDRLLRFAPKLEASFQELHAGPFRQRLRLAAAIAFCILLAFARFEPGSLSDKGFVTVWIADGSMSAVLFLTVVGTVVLKTTKYDHYMPVFWLPCVCADVAVNTQVVDDPAELTVLLMGLLGTLTAVRPYFALSVGPTLVSLTAVLIWSGVELSSQGDALALAVGVILAAAVQYLMERQLRKLFVFTIHVQGTVRHLEEDRGVSKRLLENILPANFCADFDEERRPLPRVYDNATVVVIDLVGFTRWAKGLSPTRLVRILDIIFSAFDDIGESFNVVRVKTIGDAYLAVTGVPTPDSQHASKMAGFALTVLERLPSLQAQVGQSLPVRIGIGSGSLVSAVVGQTRFSWAIWGPAVTAAGLMEQTGSTDMIHVSAAFQAALGNDPAFATETAGGDRDSFFLRAGAARELNDRPMTSSSKKSRRQSTIDLRHILRRSQFSTMNSLLARRSMVGPGHDLRRSRWSQRSFRSGGSKASGPGGLRDAPTGASMLSLPPETPPGAAQSTDGSAHDSTSVRFIDDLEDNLEDDAEDEELGFEVPTELLDMVPMGKRGLLFVDPEHERQFQLHELERLPRRHRDAVLVALAAHVALVLVDLSFSDHLEVRIPLRLFGPPLVLLGHLGVIRRAPDWYRCHAQVVSVLSFACAGLLAALNAGLVDGDYPIGAMLIVTMVGMSTGALLPRAAIVQGVVLVFGYTVILSMMGASDDLLFELAFAGVIGFIVGAFVSYFLKLERRSAFRLVHILKLQAARLDQQKQHLEHLLRCLLPPSLVTRLKRGEPVSAQLFANAGFLFAQLDFAQLEDGDEAEAALEVLNDVFGQFDAAAERLGLEVIKTIGATFLCASNLFNAIGEDHLERLATLAIEMQRIVDNFVMAGGIYVRIGINSGQCTGAVIGQSSLSFDIWSSDVNLASRMCTTANRGEIQITPWVNQGIERKMNTVLRGQVQVKGVGELDTYVVTAEEVKEMLTGLGPVA